MSYYCNTSLTFAEAVDIATRRIKQEDVKYFAGAIIADKTAMTIEEIKKLLILLITEYEFDITCDNNQTILRCYRHDNPEMISLLIELGADVNAMNDQLFFRSCTYNNVNLVKFLLDYVDLSKNNKALLACVDNDHSDLINILLEAGMDPNGNDTRALIMSSVKGNYHVTKLLLEYGANVNARNNEALMSATLNGKYDIVELLISYGANLKCFMQTKYSNDDYEKTCKLLMSEGVDPLSLMTLFARFNTAK